MSRSNVQPCLFVQGAASPPMCPLNESVHIRETRVMNFKCESNSCFGHDILEENFFFFTHLYWKCVMVVALRLEEVMVVGGSQFGLFGCKPHDLVFK